MDLDRRLDPEIAAALAELPILDLSDIPAARETMLARRAAAAADAQPSPTVVRQDHLVPGLNGAPEVRVRHYRPASQSGVLPCLYWIHGSGHVLGQVDQDDLVMDHIVDTVGGAVVSVDWRRAPEHPFPAPMDDCYAGLAWTHRHAAELNVDPERIAVGGASSGGGSAAGLVLLARDRGEFPVCFPAADLSDARRPQCHPGQRDADRSAGLEPRLEPDRVAGVRRRRGRHRPGLSLRRHRVRPAAAAGRRSHRTARLPGWQPRVRVVRSRLGAGPAFRPGPDEALVRAFRM